MFWLSTEWTVYTALCFCYTVINMARLIGSTPITRSSPRLIWFTGRGDMALVVYADLGGRAKQARGLVHFGAGLPAGQRTSPPR